MSSIRNRAQYPRKITKTIILLSIISSHANNVDTKSSFIASSNAHFVLKCVPVSESGDIGNNKRRVRILSKLPIKASNNGRLRYQGDYTKKSPFTQANETQMTLWQILTKVTTRELGRRIPGAIDILRQVICIENNERKVRKLSELPRKVEPNKSGLRAQGGYTKKSPFVRENENETKMTLWQILAKAGKRGLGGGIPGAIAGLVQVICLMWLRTIVNYQYRYGTTFQIACMTLYNEGGGRRFYRGLSFALIQAPLSRFVSTAANDGVDVFLNDLKFVEAWGPNWSVMIASFVVGVWRIVLMPIDTCKTVLQVDSVKGFDRLIRKVKAGKVRILYEGALAQALHATLSHYPWFYTYNLLSKNNMIQSVFQNKLLRNAAIGFMSSALSDSFTNSIRVIKTTKQAAASKRSVSYSEAVAMIFAADGWKGLFGRGLRTRILGNAVQSVLFTVVWRGLADRWSSDMK